MFLASWALAGRSWDLQTTPLLERGYRCVTLDRRGHGRSDDPGRGYDLDTLAEDVAALLDRLDLMDVSLVGFSMGCAEAVRVASTRRARVGRLVLIGTTTPFPLRTDDNPGGIDPAVFTQFQDQLLANYPQWIEENLQPFATTASPGMKAWIKTQAHEPSLYALLACNRTLSTADQREELAELDLPALLIHGDRDVTSPFELTGRPTASLLRGSRLEVYEEASHGLMYTHSERLNRDLLSFLG